MRHTRLFISHTVHIAPQYVLSFSYYISYALSSPYLILPSFLLRIRLLPSMRRAALCFMNRLLFCFTSHPYFFRAHRILYTCFPMLILPPPLLLLAAHRLSPPSQFPFPPPPTPSVDPFLRACWDSLRGHPLADATASLFASTDFDVSLCQCIANPAYRVARYASRTRMPPLLSSSR